MRPAAAHRAPASGTSIGTSAAGQADGRCAMVFFLPLVFIVGLIVVLLAHL